MNKFIILSFLSIFIFCVTSGVKASEDSYNNAVSNAAEENAKKKRHKNEKKVKKVKYKHRRMNRKAGLNTKIPKRLRQYKRNERKIEKKEAKEAGIEDVAKTREERRKKRKNRIMDNSDKRKESARSRAGYGDYYDTD